MAYQIKLYPKAEKDLAKIPKPYYQRLLTALTSLSQNPWAGKKLTGVYKDCYSLRIWPYRIIYQIYKKDLIVIIIRIGHRQGVYN